MSKIGLVLEGGGMRGLFTCGVLEFFLDEEMYFPYVVGVSAGASNTCNYIARQKGRSKRVNINYLKDWRYMGVRSLLLNGSYFGMDFIFGELPTKIDPFDFDTFYKTPGTFKWGATNCKTGEVHYFYKNELNTNLDQIRASCSLPLLSPIVEIEGVPYLDGGIAEPIPYKKALADGCEKLVIVLTQPKGYFKKPLKSHIKKIYKMKYGKYPKLLETLSERYKLYNQTLAEIEELEKKGEVVVIRPSGAVKMGRFENDPSVLSLLFEEGYRNASRCGILETDLHI